MFMITTMASELCNKKYALMVYNGVVSCNKCMMVAHNCQNYIYIQIH